MAHAKELGDFGQRVPVAVLQDDDGAFPRRQGVDQLAQLEARGSRCRSLHTGKSVEQFTKSMPSAFHPEASMHADPGEPGLRREWIAKLADPGVSDEIRVVDDILRVRVSDEGRRDALQPRARGSEDRVEVVVVMADDRADPGDEALKLCHGHTR